MSRTVVLYLVSHASGELVEMLARNAVAQLAGVEVRRRLWKMVRRLDQVPEILGVLAAADMASLPPQASGERGVILSTASVSAYEGQSGEAAYSASKGGVVSMILPAARELGPLGIRVVGIAPGLFGTQTLFDMEKNLDSRLARQIPFPHRFGDPAEFAMLVLHVIKNVMINGSVLRLDGGYHR